MAKQSSRADSNYLNLFKFASKKDYLDLIRALPVINKTQNHQYYDKNSKNHELWSSGVDKMMGQLAKKLGEINHVAFDNTRRNNRFYAYKLPSLEEAVLQLLSCSSAWCSLDTESITNLLTHSEDVPIKIDSNADLVLGGLPGQSAVSYLKMQTFYAVNIICNLSLSLRSPVEDDCYHDDFEILRSLHEQTKSKKAVISNDMHTLRQLCFIALLNERVKQDVKLMRPFKEKQKRLITMDLDPFIRSQALTQLEEKRLDLIKDLTREIFFALHKHLDKCSVTQVQAIVDLVFQQLHAEEKLGQASIARCIQNVTQNKTSQLRRASAYLSSINNHLRELEDHIMQSRRDDAPMIRQNFTLFRDTIQQHSLIIVQTMLSYRSKAISTKTAWNAVARAQEEIRRATTQFQSQVPPQYTRLVTRVFLTAVSLVTLGLGALAIAWYNKRFYPKKSQTYTGALAQRVSLFTHRLPKVASCKARQAAYAK